MFTMPPEKALRALPQRSREKYTWENGLRRLKMLQFLRFHCCEQYNVRKRLKAEHLVDAPDSDGMISYLNEIHRLALVKSLMEYFRLTGNASIHEISDLKLSLENVTRKMNPIMDQDFLS
jgi:hypothetical protein